MGKALNCGIVSAAVLFTGAAAAEPPTAEDVVRQCYYKDNGRDQMTDLVITIKNGEGVVSRSRFVRIWKDYGGEGGLMDKMALFTVEPPENRGVNFMRWGYTPDSGRPPEQWVYLPELRKVRRVSQRDPADISWGLTDEDFRIRQLAEDKHSLVEVKKEDHATVYVVESVPKDPSSQYGKWISEFESPDRWENCTLRSTRYFDKGGRELKTVSYSWHQVDDAWIWNTVTIESAKSDSVVVYAINNVKVNVGLDDKDFTERQLIKGVRMGR